MSHKSEGIVRDESCSWGELSGWELPVVGIVWVDVYGNNFPGWELSGMGVVRWEMSVSERFPVGVVRSEVSGRELSSW